MIRIFSATETDFTHDGIEVLDDIVISSVTNWNENSKWVIESKFKKDFEKSEEIQNGRILKVPTEKGEQLFQIIKLNKKNRKTITAYGHAIGHSFEDNFIQDINIVEKSGRLAIQQISTGTVESHRYNLTSNIDTVASARMVRKNGVSALLGDKDNSFVSRWGGYLVLDNFNISMNSSVGVDRGVEIAIGKNVIDYDGDIDETTVVTGINAITYDGLTLPEGIYYSPLANNYSNKKIKEFKFDKIKYKYSDNNTNQEGYETLEEVYTAIRKACDDLFNKDNIDKPNCSLRVNIAALEHTDQFKGDELNERIFQGDILTANLDDYGFDVKLKMVANRYDNVRDKYIDIDLGDAKANALNDIGKVEEVVNGVVDQLGGNSWQDILDKSMEEAAKLIAEGIKDSYVICRKNEILIMDDPVVESAINVIRMNKNGIAFSQSGYNGPYTVAITIDGKINASCISTGELNAALIKTGVLTSSNGLSWINMETGTFSFGNGALEWQNDILSIKGDVAQIDKSTNKKACEIKDNAFIIYDHLTEESDSHEIGRIRAYKTKNKIDASARNAIALNATNGDLLIIGYVNTNGDFIETMVFDNTKAYDGISTASINGALKAYHIYFQNTTDTFSGDILGDGKNLRFRTSLNEGGMFVFGEAGSLTDNAMQISKETLFHKGNISCGGTKNRIVETKNYGKRALNAYETASCYFGDIGEASTDENCTATIILDEILLQTVNITNYHVFLSKYGAGDIWVNERNSASFTVKSSVPNLKFSWEFKAKQKNYENERLKEFKEG